MMTTMARLIRQAWHWWRLDICSGELAENLRQALKERDDWYDFRAKWYDEKRTHDQTERALEQTRQQLHNENEAHARTQELVEDMRQQLHELNQEYARLQAQFKVETKALRGERDSARAEAKGTKFELIRHLGEMDGLIEDVRRVGARLQSEQEAHNDTRHQLAVEQETTTALRHDIEGLKAQIALLH